MLLDGISSHNNSGVQTAIRAIELIFLSAGFVSTILIFKGAVESSCSCDIFLSTLKKSWVYFRSRLSSPFYICIIMNSIVILIAASSFHHRHYYKMDANYSDPVTVCDDTKDDDFEYAIKDDYHNDLWTEGEVQNYTFKIESLTKKEEIKMGKAHERKQESKKEQPKTRNTEEEEDTMEATWRAITGEGGAKSENKQLKKSETWAQENMELEEEEEEEEGELNKPSRKELKKSLTFNDTVSIRCRGGLMRDPSMSLEEFNGKVEAFIKKFNYEMRLQRQESDQRYLEMINRSL